ncbi:hypothetical protein sscle_12g087310 [Sclerotinia sclerotiorum 1980 UF-70]|uniref:Uncharacterized protein n=1 Tax=Sclerotinia sclerotiorum (strain ATCC 18683 / 1980 / Ss-1) TaxID=665079 RepID=A0A1D9QGE3_SCLS1|nr:hypothetical protein sscle_12g087310 [Sclerotinia sclerotiorum 1980 UF-70]
MLTSCVFIGRYITSAALPACRRPLSGEVLGLQRLQVAHNATAGNASVIANGALPVAVARAGFPLNVRPWVQEVITSDCINQNYQVPR